MHDDLQPGPDETLDHLTGDWRQFQLARGHRSSLDDLVTAWLALRTRPSALRALDLGSGTGSVGLTVLRLLPPEAHLTAVEAQDISVGLFRRTLRVNGIQHRVTSLHSDLRAPAVAALGPRFDLVTGSPPYIPASAGRISPHPQKAHCRMELRGDVFDYARAAAALLAPDGAFVVCHAAADPRPLQAIEAAGLHLWRRLPVITRPGPDQPPLIAVYSAGREPASGGPVEEPPLVVRHPDGGWTEAYRGMRRALGRERPEFVPGR